MAENSEWKLYDGRKVKPLLIKLAKDIGKPYEEVKKGFIERYAKDSIKELEKAIEKVFHPNKLAGEKLR